MKQIFKKIVQIADQLDRQGCYKYADMLDEIVKKKIIFCYECSEEVPEELAQYEINYCPKCCKKRLEQSRPKVQAALSCFSGEKYNLMHVFSILEILEKSKNDKETKKQALDILLRAYEKAHKAYVLARNLCDIIENKFTTVLSVLTDPKLYMNLTNTIIDIANNIRENRDNLYTLRFLVMTDDIEGWTELYHDMMKKTRR